ncbi:RNA degradosome polyphosphate kinase [Bacteroides ihuae]|uniref:RNA degradosome polyphosphate kinase n=1 Tax=Bacteroides ihuae TaxID=1852362 RepID=UPI0008DA1BF5|nr:RNA degradosome polyphosphate kinase [Bacteroides ihuae]
MNKKKTIPSIDRDLSWMYFNRRILSEAMKPNVPLLERLSFLGIYSNNLDEFFRVRMATLSRIVEYEDRSLRLEREHAKLLIKQIHQLNSKYSIEYESAIKEVTSRLREENIYLLNENELDVEQQIFVRNFFRRQLSGFVSPIWLSAVKQLTEATDENIYLAIKMQVKKNSEEDEKKKTAHIRVRRPEYALIELPVSTCGRFVRLPDRSKGGSSLMYLDDIIRFCLPMIFSGMDYNHFDAYAFKFTKDAEMEIDNDLRNGRLQKISKAVKSRKRGDALRVIYDTKMPRDLLSRIMKRLNLDKSDTVQKGGRYHNHKDLMSFPDCGRKDLKYPAWVPILKPELKRDESLLKLIQKQDRYIHVPYHSFDYYIRVLQEAAVSKEVRSIKTTLYRLAKESKVVKALICAALNGKKVTVVIELLARFDEASNINWSKKMQDAGIQVLFGLEGVKVHSKITHISMKRGGDIACISTGNFHEGNASMYTDYLLMTAKLSIVRDVNSVFDFIEKPYLSQRFKELLVSPNEMKKRFLSLISDEIRNKKAGLPAYIHVKVNHVTDDAIIEKLYEASKAGVPVELLVRGNCTLLTGISGLSDTIRINGIIDRYLEHARIFIFAAGGENKTFIGSADWMRRNLDNRVEVITPVYDPLIKENLQKVFDFGFRDTCQGCVVDGTGENRPWTREDGNTLPFRSQEELYNDYKLKE